MQLTTSSADFEHLFESAPISLWLEDYSALKILFDAWRAEGVVDLAAHLSSDVRRVAQCSSCYQVLRVNQKTLDVFAATSQSELLARLPEVFRDDMLDGMVSELSHLWSGRLEFSNQTVNFALDGRRLDVQIHVRVLQGHEDTWSRVMVSLEDITSQVLAQKSLVFSEQYARDLFEHSPVSLWVEDFSGVKDLLDEARAQGIQDFRVFISVHPDFVQRCIEKIKVLDVNQQTLRMLAARSKQELLDSLDAVFRDEMRVSFADQLFDLWQGKTTQMREVINYALSGDLVNIHMQFAVLAGYEAQWDRVLISMVDITARKKAEAYLEYLGKHDSLTRLGNRAFYVEELNRVSRKGPWPLSVLAIDLNGLKSVNDQEGHAAGDAVLRRAGEVLSTATQGQAVCVARTGGDEFVVLMPGCDERVAQALHDRIVSTVELNNQYYPGQRLSMAIGIALCSGAGELDAALNAADKAMFAQKECYYAESKTDRRRF
jgi:diguanylate cyclase (GGDEF)-like protein